MSIHPSASVHPAAELGDGIIIGPYAVVEAEVRLADRCRVGPFCVLKNGVQLGEGVELDVGVVLGGEPQDLKYRGEASQVIIGAGCKLREYVTVNRGTSAHGKTLVGENGLIMAYAHIAHDCRVGKGVVIANGVQMGGHVRIGDSAVVSGMTGIHQFVAIGAGAFIGGNLRVDKDIPPGIKALGNPLRWGGLNVMGWERLGYPRECLGSIETFYRILRKQGVESALAFWDIAGANNDDVSARPARELARLFREFFGECRRGLLLRGDGPGLP